MSAPPDSPEPPAGLPAGAVQGTPRRDDDFGERFTYLVLAATWAVCIYLALGPLADGGSQSRRDLHRYLVPLLSASVLLLPCVLTARTTSLGRAARWVALGGIAVATLFAIPMAAMFIFIGLAALVTGSGAGASLLFFLGMLALAGALLLLIRSVR